MPFIAMMYPRGENIKEPVDPMVIAHTARIGAEAGADVVKTVYTGDEASFREVVRKCPVPVVLAGGAKTDDDAEVLRLAETAMKAGAMGVTFGRNVFQHPNPTLMVRALKKIIIDKESVEVAMEVLKGANTS
jgi:fructose-bisphosphate aldolase/2-amino-3,7-dideoxy-D-threo-hept-6-ulosonate synthase